jgi:xylulokinase
MANDTWASVVGLGAMRDGRAYNLSGTTEVFGVVTGAPASAQGLLDVDWGGGLHQLGGPGENGADALAWVASLADIDHAGTAGASVAEAGAAERDVGHALARWLAEPRDPDPVLFLPYLRGERVPYWDPRLRGAFLGLNRRHRVGDLAWAVMEGIALANRTVLERAEAGIGRRASEVRFGGGGAANREWCRLKADVLQRPVVVTTQSEHGLVGAAIVARKALGEFATLDDAQSALVRIAERFEPDPRAEPRYSRLHALFRQATESLAPISHALADWQARANDGQRDDARRADDGQPAVDHDGGDHRAEDADPFPNSTR